MKIVAHTPTELIIRDSAMSLRALGAFLVALAAFIVWIGMTQDPERIGIFPLVVGAIVALGGLTVLATTAYSVREMRRARKAESDQAG